MHSFRHPLRHRRLLKRLLNLLQRSSPRLRHENRTNQRRQQRAPTKQEINPITAVSQQYRRRQRNQEIRTPVTSMRQTCSRSARVLGLDFGGVDFDAHAPGQGE